MTRFIVVGGAGFIGSHLVESLLPLGEVLVIDPVAMPIPRRTETQLHFIAKRIEELSNHEIMYHDYLKEPIRYIFHLACYPRQHSFQNPMEDMRTNVGSMLKTLDLARETGAKVIFSSNSGIYGADKVPTDESCQDNPLSPYDVHKLAAEYHMKVYHRVYGVPITIFRFATVYGPGQRTSPEWKPVIAEFIDKLLKRKAPTIWGDGSVTRDFIYVEDIVSALVKSMDVDTGETTTILSSCTETSVMEVYNKVSKILGSNILPDYAASKPGEIMRMKLDNSRARHVLNWSPSVPLHEGLQHTVDYMRYPQ